MSDITFAALEKQITVEMTAKNYVEVARLTNVIVSMQKEEEERAVWYKSHSQKIKDLVVILTNVKTREGVNTFSEKFAEVFPKSRVTALKAIGKVWSVVDGKPFLNSEQIFFIKQGKDGSTWFVKKDGQGLPPTVSSAPEDVQKLLMALPHLDNKNKPIS